MSELKFSMVARVTVIFAMLGAAPRLIHGSITVLVGEPFGSFGAKVPVGHATIYLDRVCAEGPLKLRMCRPDEPQGVAIARYKNLGGVDWIATPIMQFLYAAERPEDVPAYVTAEFAWNRRQVYRRRYLGTLIPDGTELEKYTLEWRETAGAAFDRRLWGYQVGTTREQDEAFVDMMNAAPNRHRYRWRGANCANFAAELVNFYFPGTVLHGDRIADFGWMTPRQVARCLNAYGLSHPGSGLRVIEIDQLPGTLRRSRPVRSGVEAGLKIKRYLAVLLLVQPEIPLALAVLYLDHGRWQIGNDAERVEPSAFAGGRPANASSSTLFATAASTADDW